MKTTRIITAIIALGLLAQSCTKEFTRIEGMGSITTQILDIDPFTAIRLEGADDVEIIYGPEQKVEVTGHPNIISRIKSEVRNGTWEMGLENGNYGNYELSYTLTLPTLEGADLIGSGNMYLRSAMSTDYFGLYILGSGNFFGFDLDVRECDAEIVGSGNAELSVDERLEVIIEGSGNLYYKGSPVIQTHITGSGRIISSN